MPSPSACDRISLLVMLLLGAGITLAIVLPAGSGWDFANFYDAGHRVHAGQVQDLYDATARIGGQAPEGHLPYFGVPVSALLLAPLAWLPPARALIAFKIQNTAALLIALWLLYRWNLPLAAKAGLSASHYRALFLVAALLFQPLWTIYRVGGQTTPTLFLGYVLALRWFTSGRMAATAVCLVAVTAIKPAFVLTLAVLLLFAGVRFFAYTAAAGLAAAGLSILTMGWSIHQRFLERIGAFKTSPWTYNSSLSVLVDNLWDIAGPSRALLSAGAVLRLLAAGLLLAALLRGRGRVASVAGRRHWLFLTAIAAGLVLMPIVWEHYLSVLFIPVAYLLAILPRLGRREITLLALVCGFCFTQNVVLVLWLNEQIHSHSLLMMIATAVFKSAPLILNTALLWRCRHRLVLAYNHVFY